MSRPMKQSMQRLLDVARSPRGRLAVNTVSLAVALAVVAIAVRHFSETGWPLDGANPLLVLGAGLLFLVTFAFKAYGWHRLIHPLERPSRLALAAANGASSLTGIALPGRFDDVVRIAVVRRFPGSKSGIGTLCLSLFMLGLIDTAALMPIAASAAATSDAELAVRIGLAVVAAAGIGAIGLILLMPRMGSLPRLARFRLVRWLDDRTTSPRDAWHAWLFVLGSWLVRATALFLLLAAVGVGLSFPLAIAFLCAGAASAALPIAPAGAATQVGAGAGILILSGMSTGEALAFAVGAQALIVLAGAAVLVTTAAWHGGRRAFPRPLAL